MSELQKIENSLDILEEKSKNRSLLISNKGLSISGFDGIGTGNDSVYVDKRGVGEPNYIRGREIVSFDEYRNFAKKRMMEHPDDYGVFWGGAYIPTRDATNFCILGIPGSGKTTLIRILMQSVLPLIGLSNKSKAYADTVDSNYFSTKYNLPPKEDFSPKIESHRALIFDIKPEYLTYIKGMNINCKVNIVDPYHVNSCVWDMGKDVDESNIRTFATVFIPADSAGDNKNKFFLDTARDVVSLVIQALNRKKNRNYTFCDFINVIKSESVYTSLIEMYGDLSQQFAEVKKRPETFQNVAQQIRTFVADVMPASKAWSKAKQKFSLRDWCENEYILLLSRKEEYRESVDPIYRILFGIVSKLSLSYPDTQSRKSWFFLDELGNAGELTGLPELMSLGRSKGIAVVIGAQGIPTLQRVFGKTEKVNEILELCAYTAILRVGDGSKDGTANWAEQILGRCEFYETKKSQALSVAYTQGTSITTGDNKSTTQSKTLTTGDSEGSNYSSSNGTSQGKTDGDSSSKTNSWNQGGASSSDTHGLSNSSSWTFTNSTNSGSSTTISNSNATGESETIGINTSTSDSRNQTETLSITINRERLERPLVLASQISSLKTLQYDGVLLGYFLSPSATYSMSLPLLYIERVLQKKDSDPNLYKIIENDYSFSNYHSEDDLHNRMILETDLEIKEL